MEYIRSKNIVLLICDTLKLIDPRPIDHGMRTAYIVYRMLRKKGGYEDFELADFAFLACLHDIGAYKSNKIFEKFDYEFRNYMPHSIYGFLFHKYMTPLADKAKMVLYHRVACSQYEDVEFDFKFETQVLTLAEAVDNYHYAMGESFDYTIFRKQERIIYTSDSLTLLDGIMREGDVLDKLRDGTYRKELEDIFDSILFTNEDKKGYMEMLMYTLGLKSEGLVVDAAVTLAVTEELAQKIGMQEQDQDILYYAALVHDLGMLTIPREILDVRRKLTKDERMVVRTHVDATEKLIRDRVAPDIVKVAVAHHERMDGSGYPKGLKEHQMNMTQSILQVADTVTALTDERVHRPPLGKDKIIEVLKEETRDGRFKSRVVSNFIDSYDEIMEIVKDRTNVILENYKKLAANYEAVSDMLTKSSENTSDGEQ